MTMSNPEFEILAQLYVFLSEFDATDIVAASHRAALSENMRNALESLAKEAKTGGKKATSSTVATSRERPRSSASRYSAGPISADHRVQIKDFLLDTKIFPDKAAIAQFAMKVGAPEAASPKYSRIRVAHYIAQRATKDEKFRRELREFIGSLERVDPQSRGWMDLILGKH
jgi:hypothetical protein